MNERRLKQFSLPAATPSSMKTSFYKKPLWIPTNQTQPRHVDIAANTKLSTTSTSTSIHWHARVDQTSGKLPPVLGTSVDGTPIFAFLGNGRLSSRSAKRSAILYYREFCNTHFGNDPTNRNASPAAIYRICCNQVPDLNFEWISATWDFNTIQSTLPRKLALGLGPKSVQAMYDKHNKNIDALDIQWVEGMPHLRAQGRSFLSSTDKDNKDDNNEDQDPSTKKTEPEDQDVFDFCETLQKHMKSVGKSAVKRLHEKEKMAAIKIQCRYRARNGQLVAHMKKRILAEEREELEQLNQAARRIQGAWRRKKGSMASHLLKQAKKEAKLEKVREIKAAHRIGVWVSKIKAKESVHRVMESNCSFDLFYSTLHQT